MTDKAQEFIEKIVDKRLGDIAEELRHISQLLEGFKTTAEAEIRAIHAKQETVAAAQRAFQVAAPRLLAGQWPRRDGDSYGSHPPAPALVTGTHSEARAMPEAKSGT